MFAWQTVCVVDIGRFLGMIDLNSSGGVPFTGRPTITSDQNAFYAEVGRRVRQAREYAGLTQDALAARVSLSRTSVTNIEKGRQKVLLHTLCGLATALGVAPACLLPDEDSNARAED